MDVRLGEFEAWVQARVDSGDYASSAEFLRAGLRLFEEAEEWRAEMRRSIAEGAAVLDRLGKDLDAERDRS